MEALKPILGNIGKYAQPAMGGLGVVSNLIGAQRQNSIQQRAIQQQRQLQQLATNPAALSQRILQAEQPLSQNLISNVGNEVQGYLGERGLGTSPQIAQSVMGQALAPYELEQQKMAQAQVLQSLGMSQDSINQLLGSNIGSPTDTSGFWQQLQGLSKPGPVTPSNINFPNRIPRPGGDVPDVNPDYGILYPQQGQQQPSFPGTSPDIMGQWAGAWGGG